MLVAEHILIASARELGGLQEILKRLIAAFVAEMLAQNLLFEPVFVMNFDAASVGRPADDFSELSVAEEAVELLQPDTKPILGSYSSRS